ncbi:MAG: endonuclease MutS2 [Oscillospiraceae bacterium]|jgi:DNA mismatch repair protein MutS2|nr:endonuclease MutS2 [Oscillospiraceae bacterium]
MTELYEKSIKKLELDKVLAQLAQCANSEAAKARCVAILPMDDAGDIRIAQEQTSAACALVTRKGSPSFHSLYAVAPSLERADRSGCLNPSELLRIAGVLRCIRAAKEYYSGDYMQSVLDVYFQELSPNRYLEGKISTSIISEEEIADAASSELADIRRHMRIQSAKVKESLQKIIASPTNAKFLREPIITMRGDRYVVPVKSECKGEIPGLVHDVSSSGGTFFIEPMSAVNANNALRELSIRERKEIERILAELSAEAASFREGICSSYEMLVILDVIFAKARLSFGMNAIEPEIRTNAGLSLRKARHPLIDKKAVVPITVRLGDDFDTLIITGPNTGGKTVTLKTLGLLTLMAPCGLHIPADSGSSISVFARVLADIGDEQSIEQSLSTFSSHMKNIVEILSHCDEETLVLFDELGAGTDPAEGAALATALIEFCRQRGSRIAATTHYAELKLYAMRTKGVMNASCEFDVETLRPTYRLLIGIPGKSNAFAISRRLGLPEEIIDKAKGFVSESDRNFEDVLSQLEQQRLQMETAKLEAERLRQETAQMKQKSEQYYAEIKNEREKATRSARLEAQSIIDNARRAANEVGEELKQLRKQMREGADVHNSRQSELRRKLNDAEKELGGGQEQRERPQASRAIRPGDTVEVLRLGTRASVIAINKDGSYQLQAGIMKISARQDEVYLIEETQQQAKKIIERTKREFRSAAAPTELNLLGMSADEAIAELSVFLDGALLAGLTSVRIIHGKGTGVLRKAVHEELKHHRNVKGYRLGVYGEGEDGVTIAEMK